MKKKRRVIGILVGLLLGSMAVPVYADGNKALEQEKQLELHFEETTEDSSKNKETIVVVGNEQYVEGVSGQAFSFDGETYLDLGTDEALQPENLTVSFWMKAEEPLKEENMLFWSKEDGNYAGEGWYLSCLSSDVPLKLSIGAAVDSLPMEAFVKGERNEFFEPGVWCHIAVTYDAKAKEVSFYKDGAFVHTEYVNELKLPIQGTNDHKYIGFNSPGYHTGYCKLSMDEVSIYSKALSKAEIQAVYHSVYDSYHHSQVKQKFVKGLLAGILLLAVLTGLFFSMRYFYQALLKRLKNELLAEAPVQKEETELQDVEEKQIPEPVVIHSPESSMQEKVKVYIEDNYKDKSMNLNLLGERFHVTPSYLSKQFKDTYGMSPIEYLAKIRVEEAKKLLLGSSKTVEQIADEVGYFSSSVFIRSFKKLEEMTPGSFRKQGCFDLVNSFGNES